MNVYIRRPIYSRQVGYARTRLGVRDGLDLAADSRGSVSGENTYLQGQYRDDCAR
jgi:hypothetical protein